MIASLNQYSEHPLAQAVVNSAKKVTLLEARFKSLPEELER
jgi:Cu2+-exporting ATPase